jgi:hypothetical protein
MTFVKNGQFGVTLIWELVQGRTWSGTLRWYSTSGQNTVASSAEPQALSLSRWMAVTARRM